MQDYMGGVELVTPDAPEPAFFDSAEAAVDRLCALYELATEFLCERFQAAIENGHPGVRYRAFYPEVRIATTSFAKVDSRLAFGHVAAPGVHATSITRPDLFRAYLIQQIGLLIENHAVPVQVGLSDTPMPVHFAVANRAGVTVPQEGAADFILRDVFDVPDLGTTNDDIVNGLAKPKADGTEPLAPFTAQRVDYCWRGLRIIPRPIPRIFRTTFCSPTTSSTSPNSKPMPARLWPIPKAATRASSRPAMRKSPIPKRPCPTAPRCRRCRPIT